MKKVVIILIVLVAALAILLVYRAIGEPENVTASQTIHLDWLLTEKLETLPLSIGDSLFVDAFRVEDLLQFYQADLAQVTVLEFVADDEMSERIERSELDNLFIALQPDETFRLVIPTDEFRQRWLKNVVKITLR